MKVFSSKNDKLSEIRELEGKKADDTEKLFQNMIENNLSVVFPGLEFLTTEYQYDGLRPDSIAFDNDKNSFVIIEYKNVKHKGVVDQGMSYHKLLQENRGEFVLLYHKIKNKVLDTDNDVNWDETRVIFISPEFTVHQKRASQSFTLPIELYEIKRYENGIILLDKIESEKKSKPRLNSTIRLEEYSTEDYLEGKYGRISKVKEETKKLFHKLKNRIEDSFSGLEFKQKKLYGGFYSTKDNSTICTIAVGSNSLKLCYSTSNTDQIPQSSFVRHMVHKDGKKIGHAGIGDFQSEIKNESDIDKAMELIEKVYHLKVK